MQPELAIAIAETLSAVRASFTAFGSFSAVLAWLGRWQIGETLLVASGLTGCIMLLRSLALSKPLLVWLEVLTNKDINQDGAIGKPKPAPQVIPSSSWADDAEAHAIELWNYTFAQIRAAHDEGRQLDKKPWARRQGHGLSADQWRTAMNVWIAGALVDSEKARTVNTRSHKRGLHLIEEGVATLGFIRSRGKSGEGWIAR